MKGTTLTLACASSNLASPTTEKSAKTLKIIQFQRFLLLFTKNIFNFLEYVLIYG